MTVTLKEIAYNKAMDNCKGELRCSFSEAEKFRLNPEKEIDYYLGEKGTSKRDCYEKLVNGETNLKCE